MGSSHRWVLLDVLLHVLRTVRTRIKLGEALEKASHFKLRGRRRGRRVVAGHGVKKGPCGSPELLPVGRLLYHRTLETQQTNLKFHGGFEMDENDQFVQLVGGPPEVD